MVIVNAPTTWNLDAAVRETLGRPPRDWSSITNGNSLAGTGGNGTPGGGLGSGENEIPTPLSPPLPNIGSSTLIDDSGLVLSKVPQSGRTTEFAQLVVDTGLSPARVRNALLQLLRSGMVNAKKWFLLDGQQTPTMITRGLQIPR